METQKQSVIRAIPVPVELRRRFAAACKARGRTQAEVIRELVEVWMAEGEPKGKGRR